MTDKRKGAEVAFASYLQHHGLDGGSVRQHRFATAIGRRWLFDWAWPAFMFAVELEGVTYYGGREKTGRHQTAKGFVEDCRQIRGGTPGSGGRSTECHMSGS